MGCWMSEFRVSMCAGQKFRIKPILRPYSVKDRVWFHHSSVFGKRSVMYPYKKYVPEFVDGGEG